MEINARTVSLYTCVPFPIKHYGNLSKKNEMACEVNTEVGKAGGSRPIVIQKVCKG
jgi:hypothetical protein